MSKAKFSSGEFTMGIIIFALFMMFKCTSEKEPIGVLRVKYGTIVGVVKPLGAVASVKAIQGVTADSTYTDSTTGYFELTDLQVGFYTLEVKADGYGKYVENNIQVVSNGVTSMEEIQLKPLPEQILAIIPSNGSQNVELTDPCGFEFFTLMDHNSVETNFEITPQVDGYIRWEETSTNSKMLFYPLSKFRAYTTYKFSLNTSTKTIYGDTLSFAINSSFTTEPIQVEAHSPENGQSHVAPHTPIYIKFNTAMDKQSVESAFKLPQSLVGKFVWRNNESFDYFPDVQLATNTSYTVTISTDAKDTYDVKMSEPFILNFTTAPLFIKFNYPLHGATNININTNIQIEFNTTVDQTAAEIAFSISPEVVGVFEWSNLSRFTFNPHLDLDPNTWYTTTIDTTCRDGYGKYMPEIYTFRFRTGL